MCGKSPDYQSLDLLRAQTTDFTQILFILSEKKKGVNLAGSCGKELGKKSAIFQKMKGTNLESWKHL